MAFNFNWTPLIASTSSPEFCSRARELLTLALNKSTKSSVIVDSDVTVENLDLGHSAPELEVLEIGDLAQDRFRGVFRMTYAGDAQVTLKARVQINPLCTYLATSTGFTSPHPLAVASTPLSIPVRVTLSEFKLSGFVTLVFSKEKGITLVFHNDPLESMKVQSSLDSIPFIKEYLQKEIERQVRGVFQEELPLAVYKLSLRLLEPDGRAPVKGGAAPFPTMGEEEGTGEDFDLLFADENADAPPISEKNMLCLHALMNSQATLSLLTPSINGTIYRATPPSSLDRASRTQSPIRPGLHQNGSTMSLGTPRRRKTTRRIVNLRKGKESPAPTPTLETPLSSTPATSSEFATTASVPEYFNTRPRKLSLVDTGSLPLRISPPQTPPPVHTRPPVLLLQTPLSRADYGMLEDRPRLNREQKYPSPIVEKAFMMRFMAEMNRQAEERQRY